MKPRLFLSLLVTSSLTVGLAIGADTPAGDIALYLSPDASKPAYLHLQSNNAAITNATPVLDPAKVTEGWRAAVLSGPVTGYVSSKTVHKDMSITPGTPVHVAPDENSAVLGEATSSPLLNIKSPGLDWSEVSFPGPVTAYFMKTAPVPPTPTVVASSAVTTAPAPAPAPTVNVAPTRLTPVAADTLPAAATPAAKQANPSEVAHYYYGVLKQRTNLNIGGPTNAQYVLYSDKNQVLALVDLNEIVLPNAVVTYLNKSVKIYGTAYTDSSLPFAVIHALALQSN